MGSDIINGELFYSQGTFVSDRRLGHCAAAFGEHLNSDERRVYYQSFNYVLLTLTHAFSPRSVHYLARTAEPGYGGTGEKFSSATINRND